MIGTVVAASNFGLPFVPSVGFIQHSSAIAESAIVRLRLKANTFPVASVAVSGVEGDDDKSECAHCVLEPHRVHVASELLVEHVVEFQSVIVTSGDQELGRYPLYRGIAGGERYLQ